MSDVETTELDDVVDTPVDESTVIDEKIARTLRRENAARRIENRELKERLAQRDADLEAEHARINALMAQAEETSSALEKERVARQQELERLKAANEAAIARLPEKVQKVVPTKYDPFELRDWLDAAAPELTNFAAVQTDGQQGARPDRASAGLAVDEDTATLAKLLGIDPQVLLKEVKKER